MKKTFYFAAESEHHKAIEVLMDEIKFIEVDRVTIGGYMSDPQLAVTYEGDENSYNENYYIRVDVPGNTSAAFYSIRAPYRWWGTLEGYKEHLSGLKIVFNICKF